jgi:hypothetical protein
MTDDYRFTSCLEDICDGNTLFAGEFSLLVDVKSTGRLIENIDWKY